MLGEFDVLTDEFVNNIANGDVVLAGRLTYQELQVYNRIQSLEAAIVECHKKPAKMVAHAKELMTGYDANFECWAV